MKRTQGIVRIISLVGLNFSLTKIHVNILCSFVYLLISHFFCPHMIPKSVTRYSRMYVTPTKAKRDIRTDRQFSYDYFASLAPEEITLFLIFQQAAENRVNENE